MGRRRRHGGTRAGTATSSTSWIPFRPTSRAWSILTGAHLSLPPSPPHPPTTYGEEDKSTCAQLAQEHKSTSSTQHRIRYAYADACAAGCRAKAMATHAVARHGREA
jgi:hypothetical protein